MVKLGEIKELHKFEPAYTYSELLHNLPRNPNSRIQDSRLYQTITKLTERAYPSEDDGYDKRWFDFYLPLKRKGYFIVVPLGIVLYDKRFFLSFKNAQVEVVKGKEKNEFYLGLLKQTLKFSRVLKKNRTLVARMIPNDVRTGRVLGKYVLGKLLPAEKKEKILKLYEKHIERGEKLRAISLDDYLDTAAICYKAAFGGKAKGLTAEQMYRKWADGRDCDMLKIKHRRSKSDFGHWLESRSGCGGHPFEIVFSWHGHGIHLYPPRPEKPYFTLRVTNYAYATPFLAMVKALVLNRIAFEAHGLQSVLDYLTGESYFTVNTYSRHFIEYTSDDKKLLKHIEWDEPGMVKWK